MKSFLFELRCYLGLVFDAKLAFADEISSHSVGLSQGTGNSGPYAAALQPASTASSKSIYGQVSAGEALRGDTGHCEKAASGRAGPTASKAGTQKPYESIQKADSACGYQGRDSSKKREATVPQSEACSRGTATRSRSRRLSAADPLDLNDVDKLLDTLPGGATGFGLRLATEAARGEPQLRPRNGTISRLRGELFMCFTDKCHPSFLQLATIRDVKNTLLTVSGVQ